MQFALQVVWSQSPGPLLRFPPGRYVIGRADDCQLRLHEYSVSRRHCLLTVEPDSALLFDLQSRNGTWINNARLRGQRPFAANDRLRICRTEFQVQFAQDGAQLDSGVVVVPGEGEGRAIDLPVERRQIEMALLSGEAELKAIASNAETRLKQLAQQLSEALTELAQAESDLTEIPRGV